MIDEIDYFPKRDKYKKNKGLEGDWEALKKTRARQDSKIKKTGKSTSKTPPKKDPPSGKQE